MTGRRRLALQASALLVAALSGCAGGERPPGPRPHVVALGDSITAGQGLRPWTVRLPLGRTGEVRNAGVPGETSGRMLARLHRVLEPVPPEVLVVLAGTNDAARGVSADDYEAAVREVVARATEVGTTVVLVTPPPISDPSALPRLREYRERLRDVGQETGSAVVEYAASVGTPDGAWHPGTDLDGVHPADGALDVLAELVCREVCRAPAGTG